MVLPQPRGGYKNPLAKSRTKYSSGEELNVVI